MDHELTRHHVEYLPQWTSADVWLEMELPAGPFVRRKLIAYYSQGIWIRGRAVEGGPTLMIAQFCALPPRRESARHIRTDDYLRDVALEICAQIDGKTWDQRRELIRAQQKAQAEHVAWAEEAQARLKALMADADLDF